MIAVAATTAAVAAAAPALRLFDGVAMTTWHGRLSDVYTSGRLLLLLLLMFFQGHQAWRNVSWNKSRNKEEK